MPYRGGTHRKYSPRRLERFAVYALGLHQPVPVAVDAHPSVARSGVRQGAYGGRVGKKYREVRRALRKAEWTRVRQAGSHETGQSADGMRAVTVAVKDSDTVPPGTLAAIRRATGLENLR
jgi:predicted RNA binding protein YcfA (HicA-like mRNA interferase family)